MTDTLDIDKASSFRKTFTDNVNACQILRYFICLSLTRFPFTYDFLKPSSEYINEGDPKLLFKLACHSRQEIIAFCMNFKDHSSVTVRRTILNMQARRNQQHASSALRDWEVKQNSQGPTLPNLSENAGGKGWKKQVIYNLILIKWGPLFLQAKRVVEV